MAQKKNNKSTTSKSHDELLNDIANRLDRLTSLKETFKRGLVRGLGIAIGASVIAALALAILAKVINTVDDVPIIRDIIRETEVQQSINNR